MSTNWKAYQRHPISARYPDLKGRPWEDFLENLTKRKVRGRSIILYEGKILDGWQLYRGCLEKDIEPTFKTLREGEDPEDFVSEANDHRRHESAERVAELAELRRERVAAARRSGQSIPAIAKAEGISTTTVQRDISASTLTGVKVEPENGKVTGLDGKERQARTPKKKKPQSDNGKVIFDWKDFFAHYGALVRSIDRIGNGYHAKDSQAANSIRAALQSFKDQLTQWVEFHTKEKAPRY